MKHALKLQAVQACALLSTEGTKTRYKKIQDERFRIMQEKLSQILEEAKKQLSEVSSVQDAEEIRIKVLGKKGQLTEILRSMGGLAPARS